MMKINNEALDKPLPQNKDAKRDSHQDKLLREPGCGTIEFMHEQIFAEYQKEIAVKGFSNIKLFDSTRGVFTEGGEVFPGAKIQKKNHIQICVRNLNCIKGFFLPRTEEDFVNTMSEEYQRKKSK